MGLREWLGLAPAEQAQKAVTGNGAYWMEHGVPLRSLSRDPARLMAEAQRTYHSNEWVHAAESLIDSKFATVPWHLEDAQGETVPDDAGPVQPLLNLLRHPTSDMSRSHLWRLTCRHLGLTGNAFWVLDAQDEFGVPSGVLYLNPSRMTPATSPRGALLGWIVDADRPDGRDPIPLTLEETVHFVLEPPDYGHFGIGKVEAAWRKIGLSNATGSFAEGSFLTGGKKAALIWPDGVEVDGDKWTNWTNNLRAAQSDGGFTTRLSANPFPIASLDVGQTSEQLKLPELASMAKEDLLAIWGVPPSALGITESRGLNSGSTQAFEEAALWQNAIEPRLTTFAEQVQSRLVDPFGLTLVLETPEFDDEAPLYEISQKAATAPLKVDERRALVGMDPLDPAIFGNLGQMVIIQNTMTELREAQPVPEALATFAGPQSTSTDNNAAEMPAPGEVSGKAKLVFTDLRQRVQKQYEPRLRIQLESTLDAQRRSIKAAVLKQYDHLQRGRAGDDDAWWNEAREHRRFESVMEPIIATLVSDSGRRLRSGFFADVKADNFIDRVLAYVRVKVGERIGGINSTTRTAIRGLVAEAVKSGLSPAALGQRIDELPAFNAARAELISRTETALAYNDAAIGTYRSFNVEEVQAIDGDQDEACAARNGSIFTISEASGITDHPNGTLDWVPIVKAAPPEQQLSIPKMDIHLHQEAAIINVPEIHVPPSEVTVNVPKPDPVVVNVEKADAPQITVNVPEQAPPIVNLPAAEKATTPQEVIVTSLPERSHRVVRDANGQVIGSVETD